MVVVVREKVGGGGCAFWWNPHMIEVLQVWWGWADCIYIFFSFERKQHLIGAYLLS